MALLSVGSHSDDRERKTEREREQVKETERESRLAHGVRHANYGLLCLHEVPADT